MGHNADFWQVTGNALNFAFEMHHIIDSELHRDLKSTIEFKYRSRLI
jgi:hypothetical protein